MSDRTLAGVLRAAAVSGLVLGVSAFLVLAYAGKVTFSSMTPTAVVLILMFGSLVWVIAPSQPRNPISWVLAVAVLFMSAVPLSEAIAISMWPELTLPLSGSSAFSGIPEGAARLDTAANTVATVGFYGLLTYGILLFPDGKLPSRRWRWLAYAAAVPHLTIATGLLIGRDFFPFAGAVAVAVPPLCVLGLVARYRREGAEARNQIKWVILGASLFVMGFILGITQWNDISIGLGTFALAGAYSVAIAKYRLYDVDVVISRTFVYGLLAIFIGAVYVGIVVGASALFGSADEPNVWLGIGATVIIAILFQPLRRQLERVANRMVFGRRSTPYEVLSSFSQNVAAVDPEVLEQVAQSLTEGTTATAASIQVLRGEDLHTIAEWPHGETARGDVEVDIIHDGDRLGAISLSVPAGQTFLPTDERLLEQVSSGLGLALRNLQLTDDLQARVDELRDSRRRIVAVQDQTRQKLERDLHDGAQQRLVALKIKIGIGESMAQAAGLEDVANVLATVKGEADMTIDSLRTLARGIYPPLLEAEGLGPALTTQLHRQPIPVTVQAAGVGRHPREIESTVYFCVLEAVQNSIRHAQAQSVLVTVAESNSFLSFEVRDDGSGFDLAETTKGPGLTNITDRIDAVEGSVEIESSPGRGTVVRAWVPQKALEPA